MEELFPELELPLLREDSEPLLEEEPDGMVPARARRTPARKGGEAA